jgi:hypothetical protein
MRRCSGLSLLNTAVEAVQSELVISHRSDGRESTFPLVWCQFTQSTIIISILKDLLEESYAAGLEFLLDYTTNDTSPSHAQDATLWGDAVISLH